MRLTPFLIVIALALIFLIPMAKKESFSHKRQAQEEVLESEYGDFGAIHTMKVSYVALSPAEAPIADIIWIKKASEVALDSGTPYFNVLKQKITQKFNSKYRMDLPVVEGIIQLEDDPMRAEFDAYEIESLILSNP